MRPSIDYLNARASAKPASGGANYAKLTQTGQQRLRTDQTMQWQQLDRLEQAHLEIERTFADFRSWFRNLPSVESIANNTTQEEWF